MTLNLTTRKNGKFQKILGTHVWDDEKKTIVVRYSQAYRPEGHDYTRSFKVLRLAYWLKHHLLDQDDIATYETLQLLCEIAIPFTLDRLAEECKVGKSTLRQRLDNLENAELLTIHKTADGQGRPNYYILRTPYFEKDTIIGDSNKVIARQDRILFDRVPRGQKLVKSGTRFARELFLRTTSTGCVDRSERIKQKNSASSPAFKRNTRNFTSN
jgi:predicted transcriptional regulator